jgi:acetolactate decarboxylase
VRVSATASHHVGELIRSFVAHHTPHRRLHHDAERGHEIYQVSTVNALLDGVYDGDVTYGELARHGDFGLGTFNHLDGEMVAVDGCFFHLRSDGSAAPVDPAERTPFAAVTFFAADHVLRLERPSPRAEVEAVVDRLAPSGNLFYALRVDGRFDRVVTRTVPLQRPPYRPLTEVTADQPITEFADVEGTLVGFRTPDYAQGIGIAGYHLHFVTAARDAGGHVLDFALARGTLQIGTEADLHLCLPRTGAFLDADLARHDLDEEIARAENAPPGG